MGQMFSVRAGGRWKRWLGVGVCWLGVWAGARAESLVMAEGNVTGQMAQGYNLFRIVHGRDPKSWEEIETVFGRPLNEMNKRMQPTTRYALLDPPLAMPSGERIVILSRSPAHDQYAMRGWLGPIRGMFSPLERYAVVAREDGQAVYRRFPEAGIQKMFAEAGRALPAPDPLGERFYESENRVWFYAWIVGAIVVIGLGGEVALFVFGQGRGVAAPRAAGAMRGNPGRFWLVAVAGLWISLAGARAWLIPYYRMDSLVLLSDVIVLGDEEEIWRDRIEHETWNEEKTTVRCKADRVFKGDWKVGSEFTITYGSLFSRKRSFEWKGDDLPKGRALLFLKRNNDGAYEVVTAKLIQKGEVLEFGQFESNPGGLSLRKQGAENIKAEKYGEAELIMDLQAALEKAKTMIEPVKLKPWER